jgi:cobalt-zinc-cadmium efflux system membrane fusion protein
VTRAHYWLLFALAAACHRTAADEDDVKKDEPRPPIAVTCAPVRAAALGDRVRLRGVIKPPPDRDATVAAAVPGRVAEVAVQEGDQVTRGQLLAVIDDPSLLSAESEAQAAASSAAAAVETARQAEARAQKLFEAGVAPRRELEEAGARRAAAEAELKAAHARGALAAAQRERAQVRAPRAGTVVKLLRHTGELVDGTAGTALVEIADVSVLELHAEAPAADLVRLAAGQGAEVVLDGVADVAIPGSVVRIAPAVDATTGLGGVRVVLKPKEGARPLLGLAASATIELGARVAALVPAAALRRSLDGRDEVVVCSGDKAAVRPVAVGERRGDEVELKSGVAAGERVIADHVLGVEDGAAIVVKQP